MHAIELVTPGNLLALIIGGIIFVIIYWAIFKKRKQ